MSSINKSKETIIEMLHENDLSFNLLNSLDIGIAFYDLTGKVIFFNKKAADNMGGKPENFIGKTMIDLFGKKYGQFYSERLRKTIDHKEIYEYEDLIDLPSGKAWYNSKYFPVYDHDHEIIGVQIFSTDITENKNNVKELNNAKENAERYLDMAGSMFISLDAKGNIELINHKGLEILGYEREELIGKNWFDTCIPKNNRKEIKEVFKKIFAGEVKSVEYYENIIITKKGDTRLIEWYNSNIQDEHGNILHLFSSGIDITKQREHLNEISQNEKLLKTITNNIPNSYISIINKDLSIGYTAGGEFSKSGLNPNDFIGLGLKDIFGDQAETVKKYYLKTFKGEEQHFELFINDQYQLYRTVPLKNEHKKVDHILSVVENITERIKTEKALKESEAKYRFLIENQNELIVKFNLESNIILFADPNYLRVFGKKENEIINNTFFPLIHKDDREKVQESISSLKNPPHMTYHEERAKTVSGWRWFGWSLKASTNKNNSTTEVVAVGRDITERKEIEEAKKASESRYEALVNTINSGVAIYKVINDGKSGDDYIIQDFNKMSLQMENLSQKDVIGKTLKDIRPNIDNYGLIEVFRKVWETGEPAFYPAKIYVDNKYANYYENRIFRLPNHEIVAIYDDVTERETAFEKITESEKRFNLAMEASKDGLFDWDIITNKIYYSPGWKSMLGYEYDELPNDFSVWEKLTQEDDLKRAWGNFNKCVSGELDRFETEFRMKHKDGHWVDILSRADTIRDDNGKVVRMIGTHVDVSDLIKAEQRARISDERYRIFYNNSPIPYQSLDENGNIKDVNPKWLSTLGYDPGEVIGKNFSEFLHPSWKKHFENNFPKFKAQGAINNIHFKIKCKDGHYIDTSFDGRIGTDLEGHFMQTHCVFQDITETKQAEEKILKLSTAVEQSPSIIVITDTEGIIEYVNPKFTELTGYTANEVIEKKTNILKSNELDQDNYIKLWDTIKSGNEWHGEFHNKTKSGTLYWEAASISPILDEQGEITNFIKVAENITQRKQTEIQLKEALDKAKEADKLKSAFLANMSHEIRTPMNGILGFSELLNQPDLDSDKKSDYIEIIKKSGKRMLSTINDLIDISRIEANQVKISKKQINFNQHLDHFYQFFKLEAEEKGLNLKYTPSLSDDLAYIVTDEEKFDAIISNFINNAIKYTQHGYVKFGYKENKDSFVFFVEDSGIGIPKDKQSSIFERFIQADHSLSKPYEGSGLGLAISKAFADMIEGRIHLNSMPNKGSTFSLELAKEKIIVSDPTKKVSTSASPKDLNILLVEDDETSRLFMEAVLDNNCKSLLTAISGEIALKIAKTHKNIDLILMDIKLPDISGYDVTREIRKFNKNVMIIAQTAFAMKEDQNKAIQAGCDGYITKPIIQKDLFETINQVIKEKHAKNR